jgi:hypothetical protein
MSSLRSRVAAIALTTAAAGIALAAQTQTASATDQPADGYGGLPIQLISLAPGVLNAEHKAADPEQYNPLTSSSPSSAPASSQETPRQELPRQVSPVGQATSTLDSIVRGAATGAAATVYSMVRQ